MLNHNLSQIKMTLFTYAKKSCKAISEVTGIRGLGAFFRAKFITGVHGEGEGRMFSKKAIRCAVNVSILKEI